VTLSRSSALAGETVTVRWTGYTPGASVSIFQCRLDPLVSWTSSCAEPTWTAGVTGADGTGSAEFLVWQFTLQGLGANPALFCGESGCGVVVTECDTELSPGQFASAPLGVPFGGTNPIDGGDDDETEPASEGPVVRVASSDPPVRAASGRPINVQAGQAMEPVLPELAEAAEEEDISLDSTVLNSPTALEAYVNGRTDLALSARPLSAEQLKDLEAKGRPTVMVPIAYSPQAVIHNMDVRGVPIQRFRLSVDSAAKLYRGLIIGVESADLRRDNAGCGITTSGRTTDRSLLGYFRTGRSAANYTFSSWLDTAGNDESGTPLWPPIQAGGAPAESPSEQFPNADVGRSRSDNRALAKFIQVGSEPGASPQITNDQGRLRLGFVDMSGVVELVEATPAPTKPGLFPIRFVQITNAAGQWVLPTPESVTATIAESEIRSTNAVEVNPRAAAPNAYPLVSVVYAVVPRQPSGTYDATKAATGKDLVEFLLSEEGQEILSEKGFVPVSGPVRAAADKATASIVTTAGGASTTTTVPPAGEEFVLDDFTFDGGDFGEFDSYVDDFGGLLDDSGLGAAAAAAVEAATETNEEATGESTIETSASLLERAASAPALLALVVAGGIALIAGQGLKRADRRRRRREAGSL
jgi:ABC-type phosphate transport system substrate-binding protein